MTTIAPAVATALLLPPRAGPSPDASAAPSGNEAEAMFAPMMDAALSSAATSCSGAITAPASQPAAGTSASASAQSEAGTGPSAIGAGPPNGPVLLRDTDGIHIPPAPDNPAPAIVSVAKSNTEAGAAPPLPEAQNGLEPEASAAGSAMPDPLALSGPIPLPINPASAAERHPPPVGDWSAKPSGDLSNAPVASPDAASPERLPLPPMSAQMPAIGDTDRHARPSLMPPASNGPAPVGSESHTFASVAPSGPLAPATAPLQPLADPASGPATEPPLSPSAPDFAAQIGIRIVRRVTTGEGEVIVRLNPAELGRIEVRLESGADGILRMNFQADSDLTLDLIRRDAGDLVQRLHDAGLRTDSQSFSFAGGRQHPAQKDGGDHPQRRGWFAHSADNGESDTTLHDGARHVARSNGIYRNVDLTA